MKVLFLDNDGVICLSENWGSRRKKQIKEGRSMGTPTSELPVHVRFDNFDKKAIKILNKILEKTGAEYVISSDWRFHGTLEELGEYYISQGVIKKPIAATEFFKDIFPSEWAKLRFSADLELERSMEIQNWLEKHPEVTHWVAVDDLDMSVEFLSARFSARNGSDEKPGLTNFVKTPKSWEGIKQSGIKDKIIKFLM